MKTLLSSVLLFSAIAAVQAQQPTPGTPRIFSDPGTAVTAARPAEKLIFFSLIDIENSRELVSSLNDNYLKLKPEEFVIAICDSGNAGHNGLFTSRFEVPTENLPVVAITNSNGELLSHLGGPQPQEAWDIIVFEALVKAGLREKDEPIISSATGEVIEGSSEVFRMRKTDILDGPTVLTEYRTWTRTNGTTFEGALLKAEGATGVFVLSEDNSEVTVNFNDLVPADHEVIGKALQ